MEEPHSVTAYMIAFDDRHQELVFPIDSRDLRAGDLLLLKAGETVPADCKLLWGQIWVTGAPGSGETSGSAETPGTIETPGSADASPVSYSAPGIVTKGGLVKSGTAKAYVIVSEKDIS